MFLQNITEEQIEQYRQVFALFDRDCDGCINNKELKIVLRSLGHNPNKQQLQMYTSLIDEDHSGTIDFKQFLMLISKKFNNKTLFDQLIEAFQVIATNNDGYLTRLKLKQILNKYNFLKTEKINEIFDFLDHDGEGTIKITQYVDYMISKRGIL